MIRNWLIHIALLLAALYGPLAPPVAGQSYTVVHISGWAYGINDAGQVVGWSESSHAFLWQTGVTTDLGTLPGGNRSSAIGINKFGQVVGQSELLPLLPNGNIPSHAVLWWSGAIIDLGTLPGDIYSAADGINTAGQVVGGSTGYSAAGGFVNRAFLWDAATGMHDLGSGTANAINNAGQVVGRSQAGYPFVWTPTVPNGTAGTMASLRAFPGVALDINDSGDVVGDSNGQPVRWDSNGVAHILAVLPGYESGSASAINSAGDIVGFCKYLEYFVNGEGYIDFYEHRAATGWDSAGAVHDLNLYALFGGNTSANAINNSGQVLANGLLLNPSSALFPPLNLTATAGNTQVSLSWQASSAPAGYRVYRSTTHSGPYAIITTVTSTSFTDTSVTNGTTFYYVVTAVNSQGQEGGYSNEASARPMSPAPTAPTNLSATAGKKQASLKWTQSSTAGVTQNRIYRATTNGGPYTVRATINAGTSYVDTSLTTGLTYYYVVTALKSGQESDYSNQASAKPR